MLKFSTFVIVCSMSCMPAAYADAFRPGTSGSGGRIGKVCISDYLTAPERDACIENMKAAKNDAERAEVRDLIRNVVKAREKEAGVKRDNLNAGGPRR
jgi:hypothetical protein